MSAVISPTSQPARAVSAVAEPVSDSAMGALSPIARHVVAGLQDSTVRFAIWSELRAASAPLEGIDLQTCGSSRAIAELFAAGERRGAGKAVARCAAVQQMPGAVLYMDRDRLAQWDGTSIPLVTAIANPNVRPPRRFLAYRSPNRTIDIAGDGSTLGPILVVLPYRHSRQAPPSSARPQLGHVVVPEAGGNQARSEPSVFVHPTP